MTQPEELTGDPLWRLDAYRYAAFFMSLARDDADVLARDPVRTVIAGQLLSAAASVPANIAEGYGRPTGPDRIRYFSYALGSARETFTWYEAARGALNEQLRRSRLSRLARIHRILLGLLTRLRTQSGKRFDKW